VSTRTKRAQEEAEILLELQSLETELNGYNHQIEEARHERETNAASLRATNEAALLKLKQETTTGEALATE
jgi:hypothetical protein